LAQQHRKEFTQFEADAVRKRQRELDFHWQAKLDAERSFDDGYDYSTGFRELRRRTSCHRSKSDPDFGL